MTWAAALTAVGVSQALGRRRQHRYNRSLKTGGDRVEGVRQRGSRLRRARSVKASEVDQRICDLCRVK